ncbi:MAG TPA: TonB family protein [Planktothrix sp.]|jgi:TonB family protein
MILNYLLSAKNSIQAGWHPQNRSTLSTAIVQLSLNQDGKVGEERITLSSKSTEFDRSIVDSLQGFTMASPLPSGLDELKLFLTFMSDSTMRMIEFAELPEADAYYLGLLDGTLNHAGMLHRGPTPAPRVDQIVAPTSKIGAGSARVAAQAPQPVDSREKLAGSAPLPAVIGGPAPKIHGAESAAPSPSRAAQPKAAAIEEAPVLQANKNQHANSDSPAPSPQTNVDFGPYMADLQRRIRREWYPPKGHEADVVVVRFKIHKDGVMSNLALQHSSGVAISDQAALKAVQSAAPFRPLPDGSEDDVDVIFTFDYNVLAGGKADMRLLK